MVASTWLVTTKENHPRLCIDYVYCMARYKCNYIICIPYIPEAHPEGLSGGANPPHLIPSFSLIISFPNPPFLFPPFLSLPLSCSQTMSLCVYVRLSYCLVCLNYLPG